MSSPGPHDPAAALTEVLSEVIDVVQEVKEAHRRVPETLALHAELDLLFDDVKAWARMLFVEDEELGVSPLASIPSVAGRNPPNLWPGVASDEEVRRTMDDHLDRLGQRVVAALAEQEDDGAKEVLAEVQRGVLAHRRALGYL
jgi:hypothetical protein